MSKAKIICKLGPSSKNESVLEKLILSDMDFAKNILVYNTPTKKVKQFTFFKEFDCKNREGDKETLIFENGG